MSETLELFATGPRGVERVLAEELRALGAQAVDVQTGGVAFRGDLGLAYQACLWSRTASRVLMRLARFSAADGDALLAEASRIPWEDHLNLERTFAVEVAAARQVVMPGHYAAVRLKDAIVDRMREAHGARPSVDRKSPDLRIHLHLKGDRFTVSLDLAGESLHRRGYRAMATVATLKENLAAAMLLMAGHGDAPGALVDPMCGSGTLLVEGAWIAGDVAPGLLRERFGFHGWRGHDEELWQQVRERALARREVGRARLQSLRVAGYDREGRAVAASLANLEAAGLAGLVHVERRAVADAQPEALDAPGLVITDPPFGDRLGERVSAADTVADLAAALRRAYPGWRAAILLPRKLIRRLHVPEYTTANLMNGPIECELVQFQVPESRPRPVETDDEELRAFGNRVRKNLKQLRRWARREDVEAYRIYDADIPQFSFAIDRYGDDLHVQEYAAPGTVDPVHAEARRAAALDMLPDLLGLESNRVVFKQRRRQRGSRQYERFAESERFFVVREGGLRFLVNLTDYLDTGLFLDHRDTRARLRELASGRRFLNLFCYTGAATVYAAAGGARASTSVDMSRTYLDWARRNLELNQLDPRRHELLQADVLQWLGQTRERYDLIFVDPPSFSNSKRMDTTFDVQRDHLDLLRRCLRLLEPGGRLVFSTNLRKFKPAPELESELALREVSDRSIPPDFQRSARARRIHRCFELIHDDDG